MRSFDHELRHLTAQIGAMGGHAERMVEEAVLSLTTRDAKLARKVVTDDLFLDMKEREIGDLAVILIAKRQPMAGDLREIIGAIRISADLERIGDLGKNIAKRVMAVSDTHQPARILRGLTSLTDLALLQIKDVLDIYASRMPEKIVSMRDRDEEIDAMYTSLFRELLTYMMEDPRSIASCMHLVFCAKNIERIGDHATNIAETVFHIITGDILPSERPKEDSHNILAVEGRH